jgi:hypothetical protein
MRIVDFFKKLFVKPVEKVKEIVMAKNETPVKPHIIWKLTNDGLRPTEAPWGYVIRNPVVKSVAPGATLTFGLCVSADCPLVAFPTRSHQENMTVQMLVLPGQEIVVTVKNTSVHSVLILEDKEGLVNVFPLLSTGTTSETVG